MELSIVTADCRPLLRRHRRRRRVRYRPLHVQLLQLRLQVDEVDAVLHTGGGGIQVGTDGARGAEVDAHGLDLVRPAVLLPVHALGGGREAEDAEAVDVHRMPVVELGPHGGDEIGQHAADVAQRQRAAFLHLLRQRVQRGRLAPDDELGVVLPRAVLQRGVLAEYAFVGY